MFSLWRWLCCNSLGLFSPTQGQLLVGLVCVSIRKRVELGKGLDAICCLSVDALVTSGQGWTAHQFVSDCTVISGGGGMGCGGNTVQNGFKVSSGYKFGVMLSNGYNGWDYIEKMVKTFG